MLTVSVPLLEGVEIHRIRVKVRVRFSTSDGGAAGEGGHASVRGVSSA